MSDTPITDDYYENHIGRPGEGAPRELARRLERDRAALMEAVDTLTLVVGLTPIKGNFEALQDALDLARSALSTARANFPTV